MATNNGGYPYGYPDSYTEQQRRQAQRNLATYKAIGAVVVCVATIAVLAKLLCHWLRSLKAAQEADAADRRCEPAAPPPIVVAVDHVGGGSSRDRASAPPMPQQQPPAPAAVAVEMVRSMGPLVCTYLRADGWPAEAACAVCLAELADGDALRVLPVCMHYFHAACVGEWLRAHDTCPLCRAPLAPPAAADHGAA